MTSLRAFSRTTHRRRWLGYYGLALGFGGLGGVWHSAAVFGAPNIVAVTFDLVCLAAWTVITAAYLWEGGAVPRALVADLREPEHGFAIAYIPVIPLLLCRAAPFGSAGRYLDLALLAGWALVTAALMAHWITSPIERHIIHPGFSLPVVAGPFIASISLHANGWNQLAEGMFFLGTFFWLKFATLITSRLMTEKQLSDRRFPTLAVMMVPPATGSIAWFALHDNRATTVGIGLATVLAMMTLIQLFILPDYLRLPFTMSSWAFSFPVAATANTVAHWAIAAPGPASGAIAWTGLVVATVVIGLLSMLTIRAVVRDRAQQAASVRILLSWPRVSAADSHIHAE
jgi:tellurite resistance protein